MVENSLETSHKEHQPNTCVFLISFEDTIFRFTCAILCGLAVSTESDLKWRTWSGLAVSHYRTLPVLAHLSQLTNGFIITYWVETRVLEWSKHAPQVMRGISIIKLKTCGTKSAILQPKEVLFVSWSAECPLSACRSRSFVPCQPTAAVVPLKSSTNYLPVSSLAVTLYVWLFLHLTVLVIEDQGWKLMGGCLWTWSGQPHGLGVCVWGGFVGGLADPVEGDMRMELKAADPQWVTGLRQEAPEREPAARHMLMESLTHTYNYTHLRTHKYIHPHLHPFSSMFSVSALHIDLNYCTSIL